MRDLHVLCSGGSKKTKKFFKKKASLKAFGTKTIKGKKYYILGNGRYIRTVNAKKPAKYRYGAQTRKITRTIKMYQPRGVKTVIQKAYIKRTVKTDKKTGKKTYGKWSASRWAKLKTEKAPGYVASRSYVGAVKVTSKTKSKTIKISYSPVKKSDGSIDTNAAEFNGGLQANYSMTTDEANMNAGATYDKPVLVITPLASNHKAGSNDIKSVSFDSSKVPFSVSLYLAKPFAYNLKASPAVGQAGMYDLPVILNFKDGSKSATMIRISVR